MGLFKLCVPSGFDFDRWYRLRISCFFSILYYRYMPLIVPGVYLGAKIWTLGFHAYVQISLPLLTETVPSLPLVI